MDIWVAELTQLAGVIEVTLSIQRGLGSSKECGSNDRYRELHLESNSRTDFTMERGVGE